MSNPNKIMGYPLPKGYSLNNLLYYKGHLYVTAVNAPCLRLCKSAGKWECLDISDVERTRILIEGEAMSEECIGKRPKLKAHQINEVNDRITIVALDGKGSGGASHHYRLSFPVEGGENYVDLLFQNGPVKEVGINGLTNESLLSILLHRFECFQKGPFACQENQKVVEKIRETFSYLKCRSEDRKKRGVEGTHKP